MAIEQADATNALGLRERFERLDALSMLDPDWDSYGALPPTARAMGLASRLIVESVARATLQPAGIMPLPDGGLQVIWEQGVSELQIDVGPEGTLGYLLIYRGSDATETAEADGIPLSTALDLVAQTPCRVTPYSLS